MHKNAHTCVSMESQYKSSITLSSLISVCFLSLDSGSSMKEVIDLTPLSSVDSSTEEVFAMIWSVFSLDPSMAFMLEHVTYYPISCIAV